MQMDYDFYKKALLVLNQEIIKKDFRSIGTIDIMVDGKPYVVGPFKLMPSIEGSQTYGDTMIFSFSIEDEYCIGIDQEHWDSWGIEEDVDPHFSIYEREPVTLYKLKYIW